MRDHAEKFLGRIWPKNHLSRAAIVGVAVFVGRELVLELVFGSAATWLKNNAGLAGDFLAARYSGVVLAAFVGAAVLAYEYFAHQADGAKDGEGVDVPSPTDEGPQITIENEQWDVFLGRALFLEMTVRIRTCARPFQITDYTFEGAGQLPSGAAGDLISAELSARMARLNPPIGIVAPHDDVSFRIPNAFQRPAINIGGTPGYTFQIHDADGNEFSFVRPAREKIDKASVQLSK